jgi:GH15 family glucan-1,4-alpha-glucosidase
MCWAAVDHGVGLARKFGLEAPLQRWRAARDAIRAAIEKDGVDPARGNFVASFGSRDLDAALLLLPGVGFVAHDDPRMIATVAAIRTELASDGLILRYTAADGLAGQEGSFVACTFWLAECLARQGRDAVARALFEHASRCANDLGLFSEEFDSRRGELLGNFPQGLTHLAHISAALSLGAASGERAAAP